MPILSQSTLDRTAAAAQQRLDAEQGLALLNALALKWWEQGYNAALMGLDPAHVNFWTTDHQAGYLAAHAGRQPNLARTAGAIALHRSQS